MYKVAERLADLLVAKKVVESKDRDFYRYAIEGILLYCVNLLTLFLLAIINEKLIECCIFLVFFFPLRTYCGGIHMKTWYSCYIVSCAMIQFILMLSHNICIGWTVLIIGLFLSELCIWTLAPCDNPNHSLGQEQIKRCGQRAKIYSSIIIFLTIIFKLIGADICVMLSFSAQILASALLIMGYFARYQ